jgi:hypothetical protein
MLSKKLLVIDKNSTYWGETVNLVREQYRKAFDAVVNPTPDLFAVLVGQEEGVGIEERVFAGVGLTHDSEYGFFSEKYLNDSIQNIIQDREQDYVHRSEILEVGSMASAGNHAGAGLIRSLPILTWCLGKKYAIVTLTRHVRYMLNKMGLKFDPIEKAVGSKLDSNSQQQWGGYYDNRPETCYIRIDRTMNLMQKHTGTYKFKQIEIDLVSA